MPTLFSKNSVSDNKFHGIGIHALIVFALLVFLSPHVSLAQQKDSTDLVAKGKIQQMKIDSVTTSFASSVDSLNTSYQSAFASVDRQTSVIQNKIDSLQKLGIDPSEYIQKLDSLACEFNKSSVMYWTPDGNYIYLLDYDDWGNRAKERLIRVSDGKDVQFKKVKHGYYSFTWK